jgi:site-specific DNA-methyltransferase (adenine-specific)/modification methylase
MVDKDGGGMIEPYYERPGVTVYCGDCLEVLPQLGEVDAVITDPPYGIGFNYLSYDDNPEQYCDFMRCTIAAINACVNGGPVFLWQAMLNCPRWYQWLPSEYRIFAACKGFVQFRPTPIQFSWDPVIFWGDVKADPSVYRKDYHEQRKAPFGANRQQIDHPCPRPLEQVEYVLTLATADGDLVVDPFMGSGTTGVACIKTGRRFIGIEIEEKYCEIAVKRLAQRSLFEVGLQGG